MLRHHRMDAIGRVTGGMAHDFNNLLTVISGFTEMVLLRTPEDQPTRPWLLEIQKASERALELTGQLLSLGGRQAMDPALLDLNDAVREAVAPIRAVLPPGVALDLSLNGGAVPVRVDRERLGRTLSALCARAAGAMPGGGTVTLTTVVGRSPLATAGAAGEEGEGAFAILSVGDTGRSLSPEERQRAFEPFQASPAGRRTTGFALPLAYRFAVESGGGMDILPVRDGGSTFRMYLPLAGNPGEGACRGGSGFESREEALPVAGGSGGRGLPVGR